ncbi:MAG: hydroxyurea phosphotransferase [Nocardiopsaceae bacterium]|nr:hydroxyurea phosphotransferase [Nocardiopsaceae bacterium]
MTVISVPERFAADTLTREGEAARPWLARLPELVAELCVRWGLRVNGDPMHGYMALVLPVLHGDARCALKVSWVDDETVNEAAVLALWNGGGAVRLLDADVAAGALLLEWLDPQRRLADADLSVAVPVAGRLLRRLAVPVPAEWHARPVPRLRQWALELAAELPALWRATGRPFPERDLDAAVEVATALAPSAGGLLANRDMHYQNVLAGEREPWLVIDPKVMLGDAEFGLAPLLWRRLEEAGGSAGLRRRFDALVDEAGLDAELARGWTLLRAVDYQLWGLDLGLTEDPARCATVIDWLSLADRRLAGRSLSS